MFVLDQVFSCAVLAQSGRMSQRLYLGVVMSGIAMSGVEDWKLSSQHNGLG